MYDPTKTFVWHLVEVYRQALVYHDFNVYKTARALDQTSSTVYKYLNKYELGHSCYKCEKKIVIRFGKICNQCKNNKEFHEPKKKDLITFTDRYPF